MDRNLEFLRYHDGALRAIKADCDRLPLGPDETYTHILVQIMLTPTTEMPDQFRLLTPGELKAVSKKLYDRLYAWPGSNNNPVLTQTLRKCVFDVNPDSGHHLPDMATTIRPFALVAGGVNL